ncbi:MAG: intein-containing adenosylcobalamin-dependent ribonucleoside-diphosphate reductase, partial [Bacteroidetes bacterium]|nr:intein-containing adenosylcobalamin-dependent ribonucleoside-diphosphate reductase [Bacteroidota bacterium]
MSPSASSTKNGLTIQQVFSTKNEHPLDSVTWEHRDAVIKNPQGEAIFEQKDVEFPECWSTLASNVVTSKYFYGDLANGHLDPDEGGREHSLRQLIHRVTHTISEWGYSQDYFASREDADRFYQELTWLCVNQYGAFNSPVWFNVGLNGRYGITDSGDRKIWGWDAEQQDVVDVDPYEYPQGSACFIISVEDSIDDIWNLMSESARLFKFGS